jgi:choline-glycine betaine transporter
MVAAIPHVLSSLPLGPFVVVAFVFVVMVFLTTTMDSTSYTIAMYASTEDMSKNEPSRQVRLITSFIIAAIALVFMNIGGLAPLEVMSGLMGIPIIFIQFITIWAVIRMMEQDKAWINNVRPKK